MTCSFLFLTGKMSISSVFVTMLAFNLAVFPCPLFPKLKALGAKITADFLPFHHEPLSYVCCPIPLSLIHEVNQHLIGLIVGIPTLASDLQNLAARVLANLQFDRLV